MGIFILMALLCVSSRTGWVSNGAVDEVAGGAEVLGDVEGGLVVGLHAVVLDALHVVPVVLGTSQHVVPLALCRVEDVRDAHALQARWLQGCFPVDRRLAFIELNITL